MKFSLWPNAGRRPSEILDAARQVDDAGWYGVWVADHYMPNTGDESRAAGEIHEAWALLPAIAAVTERVRVGTLVSPTSVHHPAVLANRAATLDHLSGGRMVLGLGAGWQVNEHAAYGIDLEPPGARVTRFEEAIRIVRSLLTEDRTTFAGKVYAISDAPCDPKPVQEQLPILVGTSSPRMLRITARHAQEWNTWGTPEVAAERRAGLVAACEKVGRDVATMHSSVNALIDLDGETPATGRAILTGSAEQLVDRMGAYAEAGFDEFILPDGNLGDTAAERSDRVARIKAEVIDRL
ncbi:LLM class flavin-dependent oxidoreductase [Nocardioides sp. DS6]|uniref:LLM class flavin-dependent oxidoreductase n=1 Tax=Nocardioides eburneus TaxID=3231482 RepID=A0ABV3STC5_9ACTN